MRRFLIPLSMVAGSLLGIIFGRLINVSIDLSVCIGAVLGIIGGSIAQSIINEITPDEYFKRMSKKETIKTDAIEVENIDDDIPAATSDTANIGDTKVIRPVSNETGDRLYDYSKPGSRGMSSAHTGIRPDLNEGRRTDGKIPPPKEPLAKKKKVVVVEEEDD